MNKIAKTIVKGAITISSMVAVNDIFGYYAPLNLKYQPHRISQAIHRLGNNVAGLSIGYLIGKKAADLCTDAVENVIAAYNGEEKKDG